MIMATVVLWLIATASCTYAELKFNKRAAMLVAMTSGIAVGVMGALWGLK